MDGTTWEGEAMLAKVREIAVSRRTGRRSPTRRQLGISPYAHEAVELTAQTNWQKNASRAQTGRD